MQLPRDALLNLLYGLCRQACDQNHLFGASSLPAGSTYEGYHNFEEIIKDFNAKHNIPYGQECNAYVITMPAPYDKQPVYFDRPVTGKPADCECELLNTLHTRYITGNAVLGRSDASFAAYLKRTRNVDMSDSDLQTLLNLCNNTTDTRRGRLCLREPEAADLSETRVAV